MMKGMKSVQATLEKELQYAFATSDMYQLLTLFLQLPTDELAVGLLDGSLAEDVCSIMNELDFPSDKIDPIYDRLVSLKGNLRNKEKFHSEIRKEYTRLFAHPKNSQINIYETLFLAALDPNEEDKPALFISPAALDAERCYKKSGLTLSGKVREPADHMATEMEFMMYLYLKKASALQDHKEEEVQRREEEIHEFTKIHLKKWAKAFFEQCIRSSEHPVYKSFGEIGKSFMEKVLPC